jgi:hypothetical protein
MACELLDKLQRDWQCPKFLSITHKLRSDHDTQFDVRQPRQPSPDNGVAGWWVVRSGEITPETSEFDPIQLSDR